MDKPVWDLTRIGEGRYRAVCRKGFQVVDLAERKVIDTFRHDTLDEATSVCDLPDGGSRETALGWEGTGTAEGAGRTREARGGVRWNPRRPR